MKQVSSNKKKKEMSKNLPTTVASSNVPSNIPSYLQKYQQDNKAPAGLEQLKQYWTPDRIKIVQGQSGEKFKQFPVGSVVLIPQMMKIADPGQPFWVTPIFTFTEFCIWNPYGLKGQLNTIRERTFDPESQIAIKSRSTKLEDLYAICPDLPPNLKNKKEDQNYMLKYCEHINHICVLRRNDKYQEHPANNHANIPVIFSFHHSGFYEGKALSTLMLNRRIDMYAGQYELFTVDKTNSKGTWKGFNITNPSYESGLTGFVENEEDYLLYKGLYEDLQSKFVGGEIYSGNYDEDVDVDVSGTGDETKKF